MPIYAYTCAGCGHEFDQLKSISARAEPTAEPCPQCKAEGSVSIKLNAPTLVYCPGTNLRNVPDGFKDKLREIQKRNPRNTIDV